MILSAKTLRLIKPVEPFVERSKAFGMSYGLSYAGYDVRVDAGLLLDPGGFALASTLERFIMPRDVLATVHDKSTWARRGLAAQTTVIEPGWVGYLTLELTNHGSDQLIIPGGCPIAQILFHRVDAPCEAYEGKYNNQPARPVSAILESTDD